MKRVLAFMLLALFTIAANRSAAQSDTIFDKRKSAIENLDVFEGSIVDSTMNVMKELAKIQNDVIAADKPIIEVYLDSFKLKADSLRIIANNLAIDKSVLEKDIKYKNELILYGIIVSGSLFVFFIIFLILFLVTSAKKNKFKKQITNIDNMPQNNQKEIAAAKENIEKEIKNLQAKIDSQNAEKANLEKRINDKTLECSQLQVQINTLKQNYEKNSNITNASNTDFARDKLMLEKEILDCRQACSDKVLQIENLTKEKNDLIHDLSEYKDLYEKEARERKTLEEKFAEKGNEIRNIIPIDPAELEENKKENERLKDEISRQNERLEKEIQTKNLIEDELRRLIEEIKNFS
jgi:hypothetical protein